MGYLLITGIVLFSIFIIFMNICMFVVAAYELEEEFSIELSKGLKIFLCIPPFGILFILYVTLKLLYFFITHK